ILQSSTNPQITNGCVVLWKIYERLNQWLLGYPVRSLSQKILASSIYTHIHRTPEAVNSLVKNRHPQTLVNQMQAVALQILHSRKTKIKLQTDSNQLPAFYFKAIATHIEQNTSTTKINSAPDSAFNIKFTHAKFGEYLCAASIVEKLAALTKHSRNNYGEIIFAIDSPQEIAQYLYQLLGYGILTQEIEELIIEGLAQKQNHKFSFELLCNRLQSFWYAYSAGRWLDEGIAHKVWADFKQLRNYLNVEQVNAAVGINVFLLLSACYKKTKRSFSPCSNPFSATEFHPQAFTKLIAKTALFNSDLTRQRISQKSLTFLNLAKADLRQTMLAGFNFANANLANVQLKDACLTGANLADVNLTGANLTNANLTNANLTNAKLTGANLTGANLLGVNLDLVNLSNTCLFQAIITDNQKETAITNGAVFSLDKFEELKRLLSYQSQADGTNGGERTEIAFQVGESSPMEKQNPIIGHIESAEGEPIMSLDLDDYREDETVLRSSDFE
ncbi:MAG: pentapeptide repeat-containing protein, partial [Cyanobacteria bacterium J06633_8]